MEYDYFKLVNDDETLHLVRVDVLFGQVASGRIFQTVLRDEEGEGEIVVIIKDADEIHTIISSKTLKLSNEEFDNLSWIQKYWGVKKS